MKTTRCPLEPPATAWLRMAWVIIAVMVSTSSCIQNVLKLKILHEVSNSPIEHYLATTTIVAAHGLAADY